MIRNRAFWLLIVTMLCISIIGISMTYFIAKEALFVAIIMCVLLIGVTYAFTFWRYRHIKRLSTYLRHIISGHYDLDVRDNDEGELSILKNEIFKVTTRLSEQQALLQADKVHLTNAISDISHQLKTPLTSMTVMADLLNDEALPQVKRAQFTRTIRMQLERIDWLVSSLLKLSKIDAGTVQFQRKQMNVKQLIETALEPVMIPVDVKDVTVQLNGADTTTAYIDFNWTIEAFINILRNAVSHTSDGGKITISWSENVLFTEITIQDDGPGIPKNDLPYIFNRFYRGENASDDSVGIGLAMAYSIVKEQDGDIEVASSSQTGTAFTIKFYNQKSS